MGFTGLAVPSFTAHFTPAVEVGWRLARSAWGKGYATEAGLASIAFGFRDAGLEEIVSFTSAANVRSRAAPPHCFDPQMKARRLCVCASLKASLSTRLVR